MISWIYLRVRVLSGEIVLEYEDSLAEVWPPPGGRHDERSVSVEAGGWRYRVPEFLHERLVDAVAALPQQTGPHATGSSPLAVFVRGTLSQPTEDAIRLASTALLALGCPPSDTQFIAASRDRWTPSPAFRLPLRIGWSGADADAALQQLRGVNWIDDVIRRYAVAIAEEPFSLTPPRANIVIFGEHETNAFASIADAGAESRPQLIISFNPAICAEILRRPGELLPPGVSLIDSSGVANRGAVVKEIAYGIFHDQPLHEAVASAIRTLQAPLTLISDPAANDSLRLSDALLSVVEDAKRMSDSIAFDRTAAQSFLNRSRERRRGMRGAASESLPQPPVQIDATVDSRLQEITRTPISFDEERRGLAPLARAIQQSDAIRNAIAPAAVAHAQAAKDRSFRDRLYPHEERRADISLIRRTVRNDDGLFVGKDTTLRAHGRYRLRVQVGKPLPESITVGEVPPIDAYLPLPSRENGHLLTVVLYPLDFTSEGPAAVPLVLPAHGPSEVVLLGVVAPKNAGTARMRLSIYYELPLEAMEELPAVDDYRNQLVQSFLIEAEIASEEMHRSTDVTTARVEVSQRVGFCDLPSLQRRVASLGVNATFPNSHTFMLKRGTDKDDANVTDSAMSASVQQIRNTLLAATYDGPDNPRFPEVTSVIIGGKRHDDFQDTIRKLARYGSDLHGAVRTPLREAGQVVLDSITASHDRIVQITRHDEKYVFPWSFLYDFARPVEKPGELPAPVCDGFLRQKDGEPISCGSCLEDCKHPDKSEAFCVWGFWGFRNSVEQVLHAPRKEEPTISEVKPVRGGAVKVNVGTRGVYADQLTQELQGELGTVRVVAAVPDRLLATLASDADRPAILIVLGHYYDDPDYGPGIQVSGSDWLMLSALRNERAKWNDPHPVIVLAACGSAAVDVSTLVSFVNEFANLRASAVVGTETTVFDGLACRLAKAVARLSKGSSLGQMILEFRRTLLHYLSPLGLVVTAYGDADLHLSPLGRVVTANADADLHPEM
jgi:hypothetical protein